jgi:hypothetical protein
MYQSVVRLQIQMRTSSREQSSSSEAGSSSDSQNMSPHILWNPEVSLFCLKGPANSPYFKPISSGPYPPILFF